MKGFYVKFNKLPSDEVHDAFLAEVELFDFYAEGIDVAGLFIDSDERDLAEGDRRSIIAYCKSKALDVSVTELCEADDFEVVQFVDINNI